MEAQEIASHARIDVKTLDAWLEAGWLVPNRNADGPSYAEIDLARAHLIADLKDFGISDEGVPVILDLLDQLHGLRRLVRELMLTMNAQREPGHR